MVEYKNVLFCTDFSEDANTAFDHAIDLAKKHDARLHILHVPHSPYTYLRHVVDEHVSEEAPGGVANFDEEIARRAEGAMKEEYEKRMGDFDKYSFVIEPGSPYVEIVRYAKKNDIDVIVMGAVGKHELDRMEFGSTAANVARYGHCSVITIRS